MRTIPCLILGITLLAITATAAKAHDPWESTGFAYNPGAPDQMVLRTNRGLAFSKDSGLTWRFLCRGAFDNFLPSIAMGTQESALLGTFDGLSLVGTDGCDPTPQFTPMSGLWVADIQLDPTDNEGLFATTSRGQEANGVFRSVDNGRSWTALGTPELGPFFKQVRPSADASRIYVGVAEYFAPTETTPERVDYAVRYTDDNGESWNSSPVVLEPDDLEMVLLDVDPTNSDRVFVGIHVCRETNRCFDATRGPRKDRILVSEDRGETWTKLFEVDEIASFEINDRHIWVGDFQGGFWRMNADGTNPELLSDLLKPGCLLATDDALFVCGTDLFGFMLARSTDDGTNLTPLATSEGFLGNPVCGPSDLDGGVNVAAACRDEWGDLCRESFAGNETPPPECVGIIDAGTPNVDAGTEATPRGAGCNCRVMGGRTKPTSSTAGWWLFGLIAIALGRPRARKLFQAPADR